MKGTTKSPPAVGALEIFWSWVGSFIGIAAVAYINHAIVDRTDLVMIIGSFGASAVLIYGAIRSPLARPRNLIGGHVISAVIGVTTYKLLPSHLWLAAPIAVATSIAAMHATKTLHPPGRRHRFDCRYRQSENSRSRILLCVYPRVRWPCHHAGCGPVSERHPQKSPIPRVLVIKYCPPQVLVRVDFLSSGRCIWWRLGGRLHRPRDDGL